MNKYRVVRNEAGTFRVEYWDPGWLQKRWRTLFDHAGDDPLEFGSVERAEEHVRRSIAARRAADVVLKEFTA